jgi:hypothetical protein
VTLKIFGPRAAGYRVPGSVSSCLPDLPSDVELVDRVGYAPLVVTMPQGVDLAAAVTARATGERRL